MDKVTIYAAINTKIRALEKEFIKGEEYVNMHKKKNGGDGARY